MSLRSKKACIAPLVLIALFEVRADQQEGSLDVFLGKGKYEVQGLFADERNPNPVVAREGTVVASWGDVENNFAPGETGIRVRCSEDEGLTWKDAAKCHILPGGARGSIGPGSACLVGLVRLPVPGPDIVFYSNFDSLTAERRDVTLRVNFDGAKTWPIKRMVLRGSSAYSSVDAGRPQTSSEGWIYILLASGKRHRYEEGSMARFNLSWLLQEERTGDGKLPGWVKR